MSFGSEIGKVLWFDKKKGYGFARIVHPDSELFNKEVFVHFSNIQSSSEYKVLYPGETISLNVTRNDDSNSDPKKEFLTDNITGVYGSNLMVDNSDFILKVIRKRNRNTDRSGEDNDDDAEGENESEVVS